MTSLPGSRRKRPWWQHEAIIIAVLLVYFPIGIVLMWLWAPWRKRFKWLWTGVAALLVVVTSVVITIAFEGTGNLVTGNAPLVPTSGGTPTVVPEPTAAAQPAFTPLPTATAAATSTPGAATTTVMIAQAGSLGQILTDDRGMTLYIYKDDVPYSGMSSVPASIAANWPAFTITGTPVKPAGLPGALGTMTLAGGSQQVTYNGMPLYYFIRDTKPGDTNGQGLQNLWYVATP
jgi:predicted lipoprotein with Yx(FWY)xxD motif